jgi:hypothetical protein
MHGNVPVRFGRGRLDSLVTKGLAAYLITSLRRLNLHKWLQGKKLRQSASDLHKLMQQLVLGQIGFLKLVPFVCWTEAREVPVRLTCCRELGGRELRRRFATHPPARLVREECALLFLIRTPILKGCRSHLIAKNC